MAFKSAIEMYLASLYSKGRDMEKAISSHRGFLENCFRHEVTAKYVICLSGNFNQFKKFEYAIEVLEGSMDMIKTVEESDQAKIIFYLIDAYIGCGEFLKAKIVDEKSRLFDISMWLLGCSWGG